MEADPNQGDVTGLKPELRAQVDKEGRLVLPPGLGLRYGLRPGTQVRIKSITFAGVHLGQAANDRCPFVESGAIAIGWDGNLSPCLPLLHNHVSFLDERERFSRRYVVGSLLDHDLEDLWNAPEYMAFRERVQKLDFCFCTYCGGCDLVQGNEEDCFGNTFPTCGGCLWAQGVIRCP